MTEESVVEFSDEDNAAIAAVDQTLLKSVLPAHQFGPLSKLINCIAACVAANGTGRAQ